MTLDPPFLLHIISLRSMEQQPVCSVSVPWAVALRAEVLVGGPRHSGIWPNLTMISDPKSSDKALVQARKARTGLLGMLLGSPELLIGSEATW